MAQVIWSPASTEDIARLYQFIAVKNQEAANKIAHTLQKEVQILVRTLGVGRPMQDDFGRRELYIPFGAGYYVVRYMPKSEGDIVVIRVWHSREARNPV